MAAANKISKCITIPLMCIVGLGAAFPFATQAVETPTTAPAPAVSSTVLAAFKDLSSEDFKTRQQALAKLQQALGEQMRSLIASSDDPEVQSRLAQLLLFNDGLMRWALDVLKLPADQRQAQLNFGLSPDVLPIMAKTFSQDVDTRIEGVKALAKLTSDDASALLARLLDDPDRGVRVAAMEAVWDRKPSDAIVNSLWNRAVVEGLAAGNMMNGQSDPSEKVTFRGKDLGAVFRGRYFQTADADIACDVLINLKAPQMAEKFKGLPELLKKAEEVNPWMVSGNTPAMKNIFRLVETYKSKEAVNALYSIATGPARQHSNSNINGEQFVWTNRTNALATVIAAIGQNPDDYKLKHSVPLGGIWTFPSEDDENDAVKKIEEWMVTHGAEYGIKPAQSPATQPAATPPAPQPALNPPSTPMRPKR